MSKFMDLLDTYLELREELKNEEENFTSIPERKAARERMYWYRDYLNTIIESIEVRLDVLEEEAGLQAKD